MPTKKSSPKPAKGKTVQQKMKGWNAKKPKKGVEREKMYEKCGDKCFLLPQELKYPICPTPYGADMCIATCQGILSARARAKMVAGKYRNVKGKVDTGKISKHSLVAEKADYLARKYSC